MRRRDGDENEPKRAEVKKEKAGEQRAAERAAERVGGWVEARVHKLQRRKKRAALVPRSPLVSRSRDRGTRNYCLYAGFFSEANPPNLPSERALKGSRSSRDPVSSNARRRDFPASRRNRDGRREASLQHQPLPACGRPPGGLVCLIAPSYANISRPHGLAT